VFNVYGNITVDYGATAAAYFDRRAIAEDIMFMTGCEFKTEPDGTCDFKAQCGTDLSATIRFSREEGTLIDWSESYVQTGLNKVEKITVIGKGIGSYQAYNSAQVGGYAVGDREKTINRKTLVNNTLCGTAATFLLADMDHDIKYGIPRVINVNAGLAFDVFDTINIVDERFGIDEDLRVAGFTVEARPDEGERTIVEVCNIDHLQTSGELLIGEVRGRVEDDFARTQQIANLDEVDEGDTYVRIDKDRGRPDYFGIPRFYKFQGEHELGYDIFEAAGGTVAVEKDKLTLTLGLNAPSEASIKSAENRTDFAKKPSCIIRFKINDVADNTHRYHSFGTWAGVGARAAGVKIEALVLSSYTDDGVGDETKVLLNPLVEAQFYVVEIYVKTGKVEFYLDGVLTQTHTVRVPDAELAPTLWANSFLGNNVAEAFVIEISHCEVNQEW